MISIPVFMYFTILFSVILLKICTCMCRCVFDLVQCRKKARRQFLGSNFFFYYEGPGTHVIRLGSKHFYPLSHLVGLYVLVATLILLLWFIFVYVYEYVSVYDTCVYLPMQAQRGCWMPWSRSYSWLWALCPMWVTGDQTWTLVLWKNTESTFNC